MKNQITKREFLKMPFSEQKNYFFSPKRNAYILIENETTPKKTQTKTKGVLSGAEISQEKFDVLNFDGKFLEVIGKPEKNFSICVYGQPGNGKSYFSFQFAKYLRKFGKVLFWLVEEGFSLSVQKKINETNAQSVDFTDAKNLDNFKELLRNGKYNFAFIDSTTAAGMNATAIEDLKNEFPNVAFIFILQSTKAGKSKGTNDILHNADGTIKVESGLANCEKSRFGGFGTCSIFENNLSGVKKKTSLTGINNIKYTEKTPKTLNELAKMLNLDVWKKNEIERIYINEVGYNTKKIKTTAYIYEKDGQFLVSVFIDAPSEGRKWIENEKNKIYDKLEAIITNATSQTLYYITHENGTIIDYLDYDANLKMLVLGLDIFGSYELASKRLENSLLIKGKILSISRKDYFDLFKVKKPEYKKGLQPELFRKKSYQPELIQHESKPKEKAKKNYKAKINQTKTTAKKKTGRKELQPNLFEKNIQPKLFGLRKNKSLDGYETKKYRRLIKCLKIQKLKN